MEADDVPVGTKLGSSATRFHICRWRVVYELHRSLAWICAASVLSNHCCSDDVQCSMRKQPDRLDRFGGLSGRRELRVVCRNTDVICRRSVVRTKYSTPDHLAFICAQPHRCGCAPHTCPCWPYLLPVHPSFTGFELSRFNGSAVWTQHFTAALAKKFLVFATLWVIECLTANRRIGVTPATITTFLL